MQALMDERYKMAKACYDKIVITCRCLTNFRIMRQGLRVEDNIVYQTLRRKIFAIGKKRSIKRKIDRERYLQERKKR